MGLGFHAPGVAVREPDPLTGIPARVLGFSLDRGRWIWQETVLSGADHHHGPGGGSSSQSIESGRRGLPEAGDIRADLLPLA